MTPIISSSSQLEIREMNRIRTSFLMPAVLTIALLAGCGRQPYLLPVRDSKGIKKGAAVFWDEGGSGTVKRVGDVRDVGDGAGDGKPLFKGKTGHVSPFYVWNEEVSAA